jgi:hypothetical protein
LIPSIEKSKADKKNKLLLYLLRATILFTVVAITLAISFEVGLRRETNTFFASLIVCFTLEFIAYVLFVAAGLNSIFQLKGEFGGEHFKPALRIAYIIIGIFVASFITEIIALISLTYVQNSQTSIIGPFLFVGIPLFTQLIPVATVYYLRIR